VGGGGWLGPGRGELDADGDPDISKGVYRWHLTRIKDVDGNTLDYRCEYDSTDGNTYISSIAYSGNGSADAFESGKAGIDFHYDEVSHVLYSEEAGLLGYDASTSNGKYLSLRKRPDKSRDLCLIRL